MANNNNNSNSKKADITLTIENVSTEFKAILDATNKANPKPEDKAALAAAFDKYPDLAGIVGNLARRLRKNRIDKLGDSYFFRESVAYTMNRIERELGYDVAPMASKLLIEQVLASWADLVDVQGRHASILAGSHSMREGDYWDTRLTRAQARYLRALETLAKVNRLSKVVPIQVNIAAHGGQQVNIAQTDCEA